MAHGYGRASSRAAMGLDYNYYSLTLLGVAAGIFAGLVIKLYKAKRLLSRPETAPKRHV